MLDTYVTRMFDLGKKLASILEETPCFEVALEPECNIVCFRYCPPTTGDLDGLQVRLRHRLIGQGEYYIVQTQLPKGIYLRVTLSNALTTEKELEGLVTALITESRALV